MEEVDLGRTKASPRRNSYSLQDTYHVEFHSTAVDLVSADKTRLQYRLDGVLYSSQVLMGALPNRGSVKRHSNARAHTSSFQQPFQPASAVFKAVCRIPLRRGIFYQLN